MALTRSVGSHSVLPTFQSEAACLTGGSPDAVLLAVGVSVAMRSTNKGASWSAVTIPANTYRGLCYAAALKTFFAVCDGGGDRVASAPRNGSLFSTIVGSGGNGQYKCIAYSPTLNMLVALSDNVPDANQLLTSADGGVTWVPRVMIANRFWSDIIWDPFNSVFVAANQTNLSAIATSPDGINFTLRATPGGVAITGLCQSATTGRILGVNGAGGTAAYTDNPTGAWTAVAITGVSTFECGAHGSIFATMFPGTIAGPFRSNDNAVSWGVPAVLPVNNNFQSMCYAPVNGVFVAVAQGGGLGSQRAIFSTDDALTYSIGSTPGNGDFRDVIEGGT